MGSPGGCESGQGHGRIRQELGLLTLSNVVQWSVGCVGWGDGDGHGHTVF